MKPMPQNDKVIIVNDDYDAPLDWVRLEYKEGLFLKAHPRVAAQWQSLIDTAKAEKKNASKIEGA